MQNQYYELKSRSPAPLTWNSLLHLIVLSLPLINNDHFSFSSIYLSFSLNQHGRCSVDPLLTPLIEASKKKLSLFPSIAS